MKIHLNIPSGRCRGRAIMALLGSAIVILSASSCDRQAPAPNKEAKAPAPVAAKKSGDDPEDDPFPAAKARFKAHIQKGTAPTADLAGFLASCKDMLEHGNGGDAEMKSYLDKLRTDQAEEFKTLLRQLGKLQADRTAGWVLDLALDKLEPVPERMKLIDETLTGEQRLRAYSVLSQDLTHGDPQVMAEALKGYPTGDVRDKGYSKYFAAKLKQQRSTDWVATELRRLGKGSRAYNYSTVTLTDAAVKLDKDEGTQLTVEVQKAISAVEAEPTGP